MRQTCQSVFLSTDFEKYSRISLMHLRKFDNLIGFKFGKNDSPPKPRKCILFFTMIVALIITKNKILFSVYPVYPMLELLVLHLSNISSFWMDGIKKRSVITLSHAAINKSS